ncbi:MAG: FAD-dependent oxidoreductase [Candidatus Njordarchaeia archaeon]
MAEKKDIVIIGGGAGGITAALEAKRFYPDKSVLVIRKDHPAIVPCAIPYIFGTLCDVNKDIIPDSLLTKKGAEILDDEVVSINREKKTVITKGGKEIGYEKLIISVGASPRVPKELETELENVFTIRKNAQYLSKLLDAVDKAKNIVIIGGGVLGVEFADDLVKRNKNVSLVEILPHILALNLDEDFGLQAEEYLKNKGVKIYTNSKVVGYESENGKVKAVKLDSGATIDADLVVIAIGVKPNNELAKKAGLKIAENGAIYVDEFMRTSDPDIFAVGDCALKRDYFTGMPVPYMLASVACNEARIAVQNLYSIRAKNPVKGTVWVMLTNVNGVSYGVVGLTERQAKKLGIEYIAVTHETVDKHPGTLPEAHKLKVKLLFSKSNFELIGAQLSGGPSIGELTNILALAIAKRATAIDLAFMPIGTQPWLTASPIGYPIVVAATKVLKKIYDANIS